MVACIAVKRCATCRVVARGESGSCIRCGGTDLAPVDLEVVDGRYAVERQLGAGAMGIVHLAWDVDLGREVALKIIAPEYAAHATARERFRREAASLAAIRHDNVVQIYAFGVHGGAFFFAMEYVRGESLEAIVDAFAAHGAFVPIHRAITIISRIASGLAAAHAAGIVHRDVKPSNIVIAAGTGRPVLIDFGLAHWARHGDAADHVGTPAFVAPEQCVAGAGGEIGPRTDVYALACTAFAVLANRPPFVAATTRELMSKHLTQKAPRLSSLRPELTALDAVIARALEKVPDDRFRSCSDLRDALVRDGSPWLLPAPVLPSIRPAGPSSDRPPAPSSAPRVLVVDDDQAFRRFVARAAQLAMFGSPIVLNLAASGAEAVVAAGRNPPQLVLLDFDMPGLDGLATLSELRALPRGHEARVVVISGRAGVHERWRFGVLGVADFVPKPVELAVLVQVLERIALECGWVRSRSTSARIG